MFRSLDGLISFLDLLLCAKDHDTKITRLNAADLGAEVLAPWCRGPIKISMRLAFASVLFGLKNIITGLDAGPGCQKSARVLANLFHDRVVPRQTTEGCHLFAYFYFYILKRDIKLHTQRVHVFTKYLSCPISSPRPRMQTPNSPHVHALSDATRVFQKQVHRLCVQQMSKPHCRRVHEGERKHEHRFLRRRQSSVRLPSV
jgi:hypothetical protein